MTEQTRFWSSSNHITITWTLPLCARTAAAASSSIVCSLNTWKSRKENSTYESPLPMVSTSSNFLSISSKKRLESQQKHAFSINYLRTLLYSSDKSDPGYYRKLLIRKCTSSLVGICFDYEQLFHPIQCTACKLCQCSSKVILKLPRVSDSVTLTRTSFSLRFKLFR